MDFIISDENLGKKVNIIRYVLEKEAVECLTFIIGKLIRTSVSLLNSVVNMSELAIFRFTYLHISSAS